ncbi:unnamed protein product [Closterium sp. NIES-64]|nr:unnamed protein product [Closterium sp. NIES-64]
MDPSVRRDPELEGSAESSLPQPAPAGPRPRLPAHPSASEPVHHFERVQTLPHRPAARPASPEYSWAPARVASNRPDGEPRQERGCSPLRHPQQPPSPRRPSPERREHYQRGEGGSTTRSYGTSGACASAARDPPLIALDDPLLWNQWRLRFSDPHKCRWTLTARDICFTHPFTAYLFRLAKCIPIDRYGGIYQPGMTEAVQRLSAGGWLHIFPEGRITQEHVALARLKWGLASVIDRCTSPVPPIILCVAHSGFENVMPEPRAFGHRAIAPLWGQRIAVVVGEPFQFNMPALRAAAAHAADHPDDSPFGVEPTPPAPAPPTAAASDAAGGAGAGAAAAAAGAGSDSTAAPAGSADAAAPNAPAGPAAGREATVVEVGGGSSAVKDEATRRLYAFITGEVRHRLQGAVDEAHLRQADGCCR